MFCVVKDGLIDDTYITLASARNLALHGHWGMIPQETANSATSPLNVLLLAAATAVLRIAGGEHTVVALGVLFVGCMVVIAWGWLRLSRALHLATWVSGLGTLVVLVNPFVLSATGLEVHLIAAVLVMLGAMAAEGRPVMYGVVSGIALVTRLDLVIFVLLIALATPAIRRRLGWVLVALGVVGLPWYVFSWLVIGSAIPDTFVIKTLQHSFAGVTYVDGPNFYLYNRRHFWPTLWSFLPAAFGAIALLAWFWVRRPTRLWPLAALGLGGGVYYVAYSVMGVPPYQWYFVAPIVALSMFAVGALGALGRVASGRPNLARRWLTGSGVVLMVAVIAGAGTIDVRHGIPWRTTPVFGNWATPADYAAVGLALHQRIGDATVEAPAEIGTLAYYCDCAIVDPFSDGGRTSELIEKRIDQAGPFSRFILRMNYLWLVRGRLPRPAQYKLTWLEGPGSGPDVWQVWSPATGIGHLVLTSLP
ncbi:hypothetical protein GTY80_52215 [Amycolatopsis sp. SID8362]|nr:hypothetical protein [Amycolatopsis sp. SID8362]NED48486.1 hypothetical protein [Amycolatopsis sp. SID8362]